MIRPVQNICLPDRARGQARLGWAWLGSPRSLAPGSRTTEGFWETLREYLQDRRGRYFLILIKHVLYMYVYVCICTCTGAES